jgi:hypothetical protein
MDGRKDSSAFLSAIVFGATCSLLCVVASFVILPPSSYLSFWQEWEGGRMMDLDTLVDATRITFEEYYDYP